MLFLELKCDGFGILNYKIIAKIMMAVYTGNSRFLLLMESFSLWCGSIERDLSYWFDIIMNNQNSIRK